jgi:hypothetical protein
MAELLIYNTTHWMDKLNSQEWEDHGRSDPVWAQRYAARLQKGHVIEIRADGFWSSTGQYPRRDVFRVVLIPGASIDDVTYLTQIDENGLRPYKVLSGSGRDVVTVGDLSELTVVHKGVTVG